MVDARAESAADAKWPAWREKGGLARGLDARHAAGASSVDLPHAAGAGKIDHQRALAGLKPYPHVRAASAPVAFRVLMFIRRGELEAAHIVGINGELTEIFVDYCLTPLLPLRGRWQCGHDKP